MNQEKSRGILGLKGENKRVGCNREAKLTNMISCPERVGEAARLEGLERVLEIACKGLRVAVGCERIGSRQRAFKRVMSAYELDLLSHSLRGIINACDSFLITIWWQDLSL